jgi:hypothetical protein
MAETGLSRAGVGANLRSLEAKGLTRPTENRKSPTVKWALAPDAQVAWPDFPL